MRKRAVFYFIFLLLPCLAHAFDDALRFRVFLKGKDMDVRTSPELSSASLTRRQNQGIALDSTDYPVSKTYLNILREKGFHPVAQSRWMNTVVVAARDSSCIDTLKTLPFVRSVQLVWINPQPGESNVMQVPMAKNKFRTDSVSYYGKAANQIAMLGLESLHQAGYKGSGKTIAVVDAGFYQVDSMSWFKDMTLVSARDFIYPPDDIYSGHSHGTSVLSLMASKQAYSYVGAAPEAKYCLLRSEDVNSEYPIEEDYWVEAVEYADSIGADIISSSLGYTEFEKTELSYQKNQLDGKTAFISQGAAIATRKGMLVVCAAGNDGFRPWQKISFPADVDQVLTVGAVQSDLTRSNFSSIGPTADGRIKPDVVALGTGASYVNAAGIVTTGNGTSFSTPLVAGMAACIWSAMPNLKATELLDYIRQSGSRASMPDSNLGYGVPNAQKVLLSLSESLPQADIPKFFCYPNPVRNKLHFADFSLDATPVRVALYNTLGSRVMEKTVVGSHSTLDVSTLPDSIYMVEFVVSGERKSIQKIVIRK